MTFFTTLSSILQFHQRLANLASLLIGCIIPLIRTIDVVHSQDAKAAASLVCYWTVITLCMSIRFLFSLSPFQIFLTRQNVSLAPEYTLLLVLWLTHSNMRGARLLYESCLRRLFAEHEEQIDAVKKSIASHARRLIVRHVQGMLAQLLFSNDGLISATVKVAVDTVTRFGVQLPPWLQPYVRFLSGELAPATNNESSHGLNSFPSNRSLSNMMLIEFTQILANGVNVEAGWNSGADRQGDLNQDTPNFRLNQAHNLNLKPCHLQLSRGGRWIALNTKLQSEAATALISSVPAFSSQPLTSSEPTPEPESESVTLLGRSQHKGESETVGEPELIELFRPPIIEDIYFPVLSLSSVETHDSADRTVVLTLRHWDLLGPLARTVSSSSLGEFSRSNSVNRDSWYGQIAMTSSSRESNNNSRSQSSHSFAREDSFSVASLRPLSGTSATSAPSVRWPVAATYELCVRCEDEEESYALQAGLQVLVSTTRATTQKALGRFVRTIERNSIRLTFLKWKQLGR